MRNPIAFLLFLLLPVAGFTQVFGGNPPGTDWKYLQGKTTRIIFPGGIDSTAIRINQLISLIDSRTDSSIGFKKKPVSIVLQKGTTISNGYVSLAPYRSEFFLTPPANPFDLGGLSWIDQLTLHEYRHVEQYSNFNKGGSKVLSILLGEQGQALGNALSVPDWFFEGDAVYQETQLSEQGRGRTPSFFNGYRAIWDAGLQYSFMKLRNGSLKHFVPDHYNLGYLLIAFGHEHYEKSFWKKVSEDAAAMNGIFYPFQKAIKRYSGLTYTAFIDQALKEGRSKLVNGGVTHEGIPKIVTDLENPLQTVNGEIVFLKSSYNKVPAFYIEKENKEYKIRTRDRSQDHYFSYANNKIAYTSYRPNLRWGWIDYSELQLLDVKTGHQTRITRNTRYFSPSLSPKSDSIIVVYIPEKGQQQLHLLDEHGKILKELPNEGEFAYVHPTFWRNNIVVGVKNGHSQMSMMTIDLRNGKPTAILPWSFNVVGYPSVKGDTLYFTMTYKGQDRTMAFDLESKHLFTLTATIDTLHTGYYQPSVKGKTLVYSIFTAAGYKIGRDDLSQLKWIPVDTILTNSIPDFDMVSHKTPVIDLHVNSDSLVVIKKYRKTARFFNFHSWQPYYEEPEFTVSVIGQNVLNTFQSQIYGKYNRNEGYKQLGFTGIFGGFYPYLKGDINYTFDRRGIYQNRTITWNQLQTSAGFSIPLNLSKGRSISFLKGGSDLVFNKDYFREPERSELGDRSYWYLDHDIIFSHQVQQARQEFNPRFAQTLHLNLRHTINLYNSNQFLETVNLYFPGIFPNHSFVINLAAQQRDSTKGIRFSNDFPFARGYATENFHRVAKWGLNYQVPLWYPDMGAWNIIYFLRIRANIFYDQAIAKDPVLLGGKKQALFRSAGSEFFFDTKWWNQLPISFGIRYSRLLDEDVFGGNGKNRWQFILPVNLVPGGINSKHTLAF